MERAFLTSLRTLYHDSDESVSSLSDKELERCVEDKRNRLCFIIDTARGLCTMSLADDAVGGDGQDLNDDSASKDGSLENTWLMDSDCSRHMIESSKWFSNLDPMIGKEYVTFGHKSRGK
eukprot:XP_008673972.1 uncharacterized protein LOC103650089 [Zea mays]